MTAPVETHRATVDNGPSVIDGELLWTSASGITTADPQSIGGCLRKWHYDTVQGKKAEATEAQKGGTALHAEIENHLLTGAGLTSAKALAGRMFIDTPGSGLHVEKPILFTTRDGVKIYGHVDLYNMRQRYIDDEGALQADPPWAFEVKDWKTTSDFKYAKSPAELAQNIQLATYAEAGFRTWVDLDHARLTHVYFLTKGRPESKLVTIRRSREEIALRWEYAESVTRSMRHAAREPNVDKVPANRNACNAYSGCPHRGICSEHNFNSLNNLYAKIGTDFKETAPMGLLTNNPQLLQQAPAAPQPDMRAQLAAEEAQQRAQVAQQQQMTQAQPTMQDFTAACQRINAHGRGFPAISGNAVQPYAQACGATTQMAPDFKFKGIGNLGSIELTEVAHVFQLANELDAQRASQPAPQAVVQQQLAQQAVYAAPQPFVSMPAAPPALASILPPNAPESMPQLAAVQPAAPTAQYVPGSEPAATPVAHPAEEGAKKKRGRPAKVQDTAPEAVAAPSTPSTPASPQAVGAPASQATPAAASASTDGQTYSDPMCVLINARAGFSTKSLAGYVDYINAELSKRYSVHDDGSPGIQDVRCAPKGSPLAFGGWKGAVREVVKADPPEPAAYHLDTFMDELNEAVADALRVVSESKGWMYIRGTR